MFVWVNHTGRLLSSVHQSASLLCFDLLFCIFTIHIINCPSVYAIGLPSSGPLGDISCVSCRAITTKNGVCSNWAESMLAVCLCRCGRLAKLSDFDKTASMQSRPLGGYSSNAHTLKPHQVTSIRYLRRNPSSASPCSRGPGVNEIHLI
ncbi:hypothetical protein LX36DRAFT_130769 [Colletotrichum falcatum]|nr:hypothetical protein LX36DRAFT_130769 [Colletotrichum falcatum]